MVTNTTPGGSLPTDVRVGDDGKDISVAEEGLPADTQAGLSSRVSIMLEDNVDLAGAA